MWSAKREELTRIAKKKVCADCVGGCKECLEFDPYTFVSLTDKVIIQPDGNMQFMFRNGMRYEHSMI